MKKLLNTLYVTSEDSYLSLDGENIVVSDQGCEVGRLPLHNLEGIVSFGYRGTSPALMGACAERNSNTYGSLMKFSVAKGVVSSTASALTGVCSLLARSRS